MTLAEEKEAPYANIFVARLVGARVHKEVLYCRELKIGKELGRKQAREGVVKVIKATEEKFGFNGFIGLLVGHPMLLRIDIAVVPTTGLDLKAFMMQKAKEGSTQSLQEMLDEWNMLESQMEASPKPKTIATDAMSEVSSVTEPSPRNSGSKRKAPSPSGGEMAKRARLSASPAVASIVTPPASDVTAPPAPAAAAATMAEAIVTPGSKSVTSKTTTKKNTKKTPPRRKAPRSPPRRAAPRSPGRSKSKTALATMTGQCRASHDLEHLTPYGLENFTDFYCSKINYPKECSDCSKLLVRGRDPKKHCKYVANIAIVNCCKHAINSPLMECVFALCPACHNKRYEEKKQENGGNSPVRKKRERRRDLRLPGEQYKDGFLCAAR